MLQLRQGFGRLIRGHTDRGVVAILDPRLRTKGYGRAFIAALPRCPVVEDPAAVAAFFGDGDRRFRLNGAACGEEEAEDTDAAAARPGAADPFRERTPDDMGARARRSSTRSPASGIVALIVVIAIVAFGGGSNTNEKAAARRSSPRAASTSTTRRRRASPHYTTLNPSPPPSWNSFPPTSGRHFYQWVLWGDYTEPVPLIKEVHNLEHGGMIIQYGNKVPKSDISQIDAFWQKDPTAMLVAPLPKLGEQDRDDRVDELGRVHELQREGVQGVPVGVPLPRAGVVDLPEELAPAGPVRRRLSLTPPGWRNWSDAAGLKPAVLRDVGVRLPPPASSHKSSVALRQLAQPAGELVGQVAGAEAPLPVALLGAGQVHPRLAAEREHVLQRRDRERRARGPRRLDERRVPGRRGRAPTTCAARRSALSHQPRVVSLSCVPV